MKKKGMAWDGKAVGEAKVTSVRHEEFGKRTAIVKFPGAAFNDCLSIKMNQETDFRPGDKVTVTIELLEGSRKKK